MCGIAGYYRLPVAPDERRGLLARMIGSIAHRGPDGNGFFVGDDVGLAHAETKERFGPIHRRVVYDRNGAPVGCYLYHGQSGGIGRVLQLLARPEAMGIALDSLLSHASELGCVGVRGRTEFDTLDPLIVRGCVLFHVSAMMVHARDKSLLAEVRNARSMLTGLAGESWTRLIGGKFV